MLILFLEGYILMSNYQDLFPDIIVNFLGKQHEVSRYQIQVGDLIRNRYRIITVVGSIV